jgi:hypothetical protein
MKTFWFLPLRQTLWQRNKEVDDQYLNIEHRFDIYEMTVHKKTVGEDHKWSRSGVRHKKGNLKVA